MSSLLDAICRHSGTAAELTDERWLQAMLDVEAALASGLAADGEIPPEAARAIADACADVGRFDLEALAAETLANATPVVGLVAALRAAVPESAREHVHAGATSQDVIDTAAMLVAHRALGPLLADAGAAGGAAAELAGRNRHTAMIGRTLLQQAVPTTFGLRAAGWTCGIDAARERLRTVRETVLAVQMGGPVGGRPPRLAGRVAAALGLAEPVLPWGAIRVRPAELATALGTLAGVLGKVARDVTLLAADEVGEVTESEGGSSSAMSHKRNPVAAVSALACAKRAPGLVATMLAAMESEHERAAGAWQSEWGTQTELLAVTGATAAWTQRMLAGLQVHSERMAANLAAAAAADQPLPKGVDELIDRALAAHRDAHA